MAAQIRVGFAPSPIPNLTGLVIFATRWSTAAQGSPGDFYLIKVRRVVSGLPITSPQEIRPEYIARFGAPPAGSRIWVMVLLISPKGIAGPPRIATAVVT